MGVTGKRADQVTSEDLQALVDDKVSEGTTLDYKEDTYGRNDAAKREFLFDVTSFANAAGGHLLIGVREKEGIANEIVGMEGIDPDRELQRFENMLRDNVKPRIPGTTIQAVPLGNGDRHVIVIHIPRSFVAPHMVEFGGHTWFYSRNSAGKYRLDIDQLRSAFLESEAVGDRFREFRAHRLGLIVSGATPAPLDDESWMALHIAPLDRLGSRELIDPQVYSGKRSKLSPIYSGGGDGRYNIDGYVVAGERNAQSGYTQAFRDGCIEAVDTGTVAPNQIDGKMIAITALEEAVLGALPRYFLVLTDAGIQPPALITLTLHGVKGHVIPQSRSIGSNPPIDRDTLLLPEVLVDEFDTEPHIIMRPIFDALWNAGGYPRSMNYDDEGQWRRR